MPFVLFPSVQLPHKPCSLHLWCCCWQLPIVYCVHCIVDPVHIQPNSMVVKPRESLSITCKVSGYSISDNSYTSDWIRHPVDKAMEWIDDSDGNCKDSLKSRFIISKYYTAVYYCVKYNDTQFLPWMSLKISVVKLTCRHFYTSRYSVPTSPTVSLLSAPIGTTQYLMCMIEDFTPNKVTVTWKKNDMEVKGQTTTVGKQPSGLYSGSSLLKVTNTDWNNKVKYSCVVQYQEQTPIKTTISKTGLYIGEDCTTIDVMHTYRISINKMDGIDLKETESKGNLNSRVSTLTIGQTEWTNVNKVQCSAKKSGRAPSVSVHLLPEEDTKKEEIVTLVCLVVSPSLCDVYIMWQVNGSQYQEGVTSPPQKTPEGNYSVTSVFTTTKDKWKRNLLFTCPVVHHLLLHHPLSSLSHLQHSTQPGQGTNTTYFM
uniref:Ig-like domain-containing protein n=1 Tax=Hucho hucho TaxID=62062 RepID=A0A4W5JD23_9TELE